MLRPGHRFASWLLAVLVFSGVTACYVNGSPSPGQACTSVGGVCVSSCSGGSEPYTCAGNQVCCDPSSVPPPSHPTDGGTD